MTLPALIVMLNKETAKHDLATLYVAISRVKSLEDLRIWPIDCNCLKAIKHLLNIKRPPFIRIWRKGYDKEGCWRNRNLGYTKHRTSTALLRALHEAGDFEKLKVCELNKLLDKCKLAYRRTKQKAIERLKSKEEELVALLNPVRSRSKRRRRRGASALASPSRKRCKRIAKPQSKVDDARTGPRSCNADSNRWAENKFLFSMWTENRDIRAAPRSRNAGSNRRAQNRFLFSMWTENRGIDQRDSNTNNNNPQYGSYIHALDTDARANPEHPEFIDYMLTTPDNGFTGTQ